jgi:hypothetical protein
MPSLAQPSWRGNNEQTKEIKMSATTNKQGSTYKIQVQGVLDPDWQQWFNGLSEPFGYTDDQPSITTLTVHVADQAALRGILCKLWDLNLMLVALQKIVAEDTKEKRNE